MGHADDELACVDTNFQVKGLEALRVADMSVCPVLIRFVHNYRVRCLGLMIYSNHPQSTAYLIGAVAVEKIIMGYRA
jgi:choline dehydrogenase-like flavoprotein